MSVTLTLADGSTRYVRHAKTGMVRAQLDRQQYRAPYRATWRTQGTGKALPEQVTLTIEVWAGADYQEVMYAGEVVTYDGEPVWAQAPLTASTLEAVAPVLEAIKADCRVAVRIETPLGSWRLRGLQSAIPQPITGGYRLDVTWLARGPRMFTDSYGSGSYGAGAYGGS